LANQSSPKQPTQLGSERLSCVGCGRPGVSICSACSRKPRYRARANPLEKRDPELYKRLSTLSRLPLAENKEQWDEFCVEIGADDSYEHLPTLVEIMREGKWRTDALNPLLWLRQELVNRVGKSKRHDDYDRTGKRRPGGSRFDKRNGALVSPVMRPFAEFEISDKGGQIQSGFDAIEAEETRKALQTSVGFDDYWVHPQPADRERKKLLQGRTWAEYWETVNSKWMLHLLQNNKPAFDKELADAITRLQPTIKSLKLDSDEAEVLAVTTLLWPAGPRAYLNFLGDADKKRIRNAFDRLDRKLKKPEDKALFRQALRERVGGTPECWSRYRAEHPEWFNAQRTPKPRPIPQPQTDDGPSLAELAIQWLSQYNESKGVSLPPLKDAPPDTHANEGAQVVTLGCDIDSKQIVLYRSSARKPKPRLINKLYSE